jgi:hypothetical protein
MIDAVSTVLLGLGVLIVLNLLMVMLYMVAHKICYWLQWCWRQVYRRDYHNFNRNNPTESPPISNKQEKEG